MISSLQLIKCLYSSITCLLSAYYSRTSLKGDIYSRWHECRQLESVVTLVMSRFRYHRFSVKESELRIDRQTSIFGFRFLVPKMGGRLFTTTRNAGNGGRRVVSHSALFPCLFRL